MQYKEVPEWLENGIHVVEIEKANPDQLIKNKHIKKLVYLLSLHEKVAIKTHGDKWQGFLAKNTRNSLEKWGIGEKGVKID